MPIVARARTMPGAHDQPETEFLSGEDMLDASLIRAREILPPAMCEVMPFQQDQFATER